MLLGKSTKGLLLLSSLLMTSAAYAAPTVSDNSSTLGAPAPSTSANAPGYEINQTSEIYNLHLATVAGELLKPPAAADLLAAPVAAKPLPPLPAAFFLVLTGFLCVSLVNDRKVWLAAFAGLLWLTHAGFTTLPKFASHIISKKQIQQSTANLTYVSQLDGSFRPRYELEGSEYIGLLRHLAGIPDTTMSLPSFLPLRGVPSLAGRGSNLNLLRNCLFPVQDEHNFRLPQFAINLSIPNSILSDNCLASGAEQILPNLPAFPFLRLARGPPQKIRESSFTIYTA